MIWVFIEVSTVEVWTAWPGSPWEELVRHGAKLGHNHTFSSLTKYAKRLHNCLQIQTVIWKINKYLRAPYLTDNLRTIKWVVYFIRPEYSESLQPPQPIDNQVYCYVSFLICQLKGISRFLLLYESREIFFWQLAAQYWLKLFMICDPDRGLASKNAWFGFPHSNSEAEIFT